jgi:hypothetical protein
MRPSRFLDSGSGASPVILITKNLQQRELFLIFTRFPFNPQERNQMQCEVRKNIVELIFTML